MNLTKPIRPEALALKIDTSNLEIPLRYYKGWTVVFRTSDESFNSPILSLFGFSSGKDLEKAMDYAIAQREK